MNQIELTGYIGGDREIRPTKNSTYTAEWFDPVTDGWKEAEFTTLTTDYGRLWLATRTWTRGGWETEWHRIVCWDVDRPGANPVRLARKGDRVKITGRKEKFRWTDPAGEEHEIDQIIVSGLEFLKLKVRAEAP